MIGEDKTKSNVRNLSPLAIAILKGNLEIVNFIIDLPWIGINAKDELGRTALHYASETDH
jgi:ankyrin repeat protein